MCRTMSHTPVCIAIYVCNSLSRDAHFFFSGNLFLSIIATPSSCMAKSALNVLEEFIVTEHFHLIKNVYHPRGYEPDTNISNNDTFIRVLDNSDCKLDRATQIEAICTATEYPECIGTFFIRASTLYPGYLTLHIILYNGKILTYLQRFRLEKVDCEYWVYMGKRRLAASHFFRHLMLSYRPLPEVYLQKIHEKFEELQ